MRASRRWLPGLALAVVAGVSGCNAVPEILSGRGSEITLASQGDGETRLTGRFDQAIYGFESPDNLTIVLFDNPAPGGEPTQAAVIRMFWRPQAGATPISSTATNATVQYLLLPAGEGGTQAGVYSGAGFLYPQSKPGKGFFQASLWQAHLQLSDRTQRFHDVLGKTIAAGEINARRDDGAVQDLLRRLNETVTQRLGYPRMVMSKAAR